MNGSIEPESCRTTETVPYEDLSKTSTLERNKTLTLEKNKTSTLEKNKSSTLERNKTSTLEKNKSSTLERNKSSTLEKNKSGVFDKLRIKKGELMKKTSAKEKKKCDELADKSLPGTLKKSPGSLKSPGSKKKNSSKSGIEVFKDISLSDMNDVSGPKEISWPVKVQENDVKADHIVASKDESVVNKDQVFLAGRLFCLFGLTLQYLE